MKKETTKNYKNMIISCYDDDINKFKKALKDKLLSESDICWAMKIAAGYKSGKIVNHLWENAATLLNKDEFSAKHDFVYGDYKALECIYEPALLLFYPVIKKEGDSEVFKLFQKSLSHGHKNLIEKIILDDEHSIDKVNEWFDECSFLKESENLILTLLDKKLLLDIKRENNNKSKVRINKKF